MSTTVKIVLVLTSLVGFVTLLGGAVNNGLFNRFGTSCRAQHNPLVGHPILDKIFCNVVIFFNYASQTEVKQLFNTFGSTFPTILTLSFVEGIRTTNKNSSFSVGWAAVYFTLSLLLGAGAVLPLLFLQLLRAQKPNSSLETDVNEAGTLITAVSLGMLAPSILMGAKPFSQINNERVILAWNFAAVYVYILLKLLAPLHRLIFKSEKGRENSLFGNTQTSTMRRIYVMFFLMAAGGHIAGIFPYFSHKDPVSALSEDFLPSTHYLLNKVPDAVTGVKVFLQWDYALTYFSLVLMAASSLDNFQHFTFKTIFFFVVFAATGVFVGPAAVAVLAWAVREEKFRGKHVTKKRV